jgi:L-alanine-DL-glutamate epimerase-like enolase superfamily enzyme
LSQSFLNFLLLFFHLYKMPKSNLPTDVRIKDVSLFLLPVETRVPLKFGSETLLTVTCARANVTLEDRNGNVACGWGETPLSVQWVWPSSVPYTERHAALIDFCEVLAAEWLKFDEFGHPVELSHLFQQDVLHTRQDEFNADRGGERMPYLAGLVAASVFDLAIHDAYGVLHNVDIYKTYNQQFMSQDLAQFLTPESESEVSFAGKYPADFLVESPPTTLPVWHLVGGLDPITPEELSGDEPDDGYPVLLKDWIERDGLECLKIKLRGNDAEWDFKRLLDIGELSIQMGVKWLTADFNCTVEDPQYVNDILDRFASDHKKIYDMILYVEQPFPYDLEAKRIDVHSVSERKPLFLDESAHDWKFVRLGLELGWSGVALKTCKTQTGALLSLCWAKAHGMPLMVQDLTNPMLAQIPHVRLAAHAGTIMGVESNGMQFYPDASQPEEAVHPGLFKRRNGVLDLSTISGPGFGYRLDEIKRELVAPV